MGGDGSLSASSESNLGELLQIVLARRIRLMQDESPEFPESAASAGSAPPFPAQSPQPSDYRAAVEALRAFLEASGYPLRAEQFMAIIAGDAVAERPVEFAELAGTYFQLPPDERLALLAQASYDLLRHYLGPEFYAAVFHP
jgi:hypothetical protein